MRGLFRLAPTRRTFLRGAGLLGATALVGTSRAGAAAYPEHPIKIVVNFAPAGPTDIMARVLSSPLSEALGSSVIVENKAGAGGNIGIGFVAHADPDGYTLLITSSAYVVNPGLYQKVPYDPFKDFAPIAELGTSPNIFLADPKLGINSIADLVAKAKADPDKYNYASPGIGTTPHLSAELLKIKAGIKITHVPFPGAGPAVQALLAATTQIACVALPPAQPYVTAGQLKALAVTGKTRWPELPDVPTMVELGYDGFVTDTFQGFLAPIKTPPAIVDRLATATDTILRQPDMRDRLLKIGYEVIAGNQAAMKQRIDKEVPMWRDLVAKAGIKPL